MHRSRPAGSGDSKSTSNDFGNLAHILKDIGPLGNGFKEFLGIEFGDGLLALTSQGDVHGQ